jgi:hypothetical protein
VVQFPTNRRVLDAVDFKQLERQMGETRDAMLAEQRIYHALLLLYWRAGRINPCESMLREVMPNLKARKEWRREHEIAIREAGDTGAPAA